MYLLFLKFNNILHEEWFSSDRNSSKYTIQILGALTKQSIPKPDILSCRQYIECLGMKYLINCQWTLKMLHLK